MDKNNITPDKVLVELLFDIAEWFVDHPQASADCRNFVENHSDIDSDLLDRIFGEVEEDEYPEADLPDTFIIDFDEIDVDNIDDEEEVRGAIHKILEDSFDFPCKGFGKIFIDKDTKEIEVQDIVWEIDEELNSTNESYLSDLQIKIEEMGGKEAYIEDLDDKIDEAETQLKEAEEQLKYLSSIKDWRGTNYDSLAELKDDIVYYTELVKELNDKISNLCDEYDFVRNHMDDVLEYGKTKDLDEDVENKNSFSLNNFIFDCPDKDVNWNPRENGYIVINVMPKDYESDDEGVSFDFESYCLDDIDFDVDIETWSDPGDYPSSVGRGPLPSFDYITSNGEFNQDPSTYTEYKLLNSEGEEISEEEAFTLLHITSEDEFNQILKEAQKQAAKEDADQIKDFITTDIGQDYISDRYAYKLEPDYDD